MAYHSHTCWCNITALTGACSRNKEVKATESHFAIHCECRIKNPSALTYVDVGWISAGLVKVFKMFLLRRIWILSTSLSAKCTPIILSFLSFFSIKTSSKAGYWNYVFCSRTSQKWYLPPHLPPRNTLDYSNGTNAVISVSGEYSGEFLSLYIPFNVGWMLNKMAEQRAALRQTLCAQERNRMEQMRHGF